MSMRFVGKSLLIAGACALAIALSPAQSIAQKSKTKVQVPAGGCGITNAALENGQTCAAKCNSETQWCPVTVVPARQARADRVFVLGAKRRLQSEVLTRPG